MSHIPSFQATSDLIFQSVGKKFLKIMWIKPQIDFF